MVKDNVIILEQGVELPEGAEVEVITQGWWLSEDARRNATDKESSKKWLARCRRHRDQMPKTTDSVQVIREIREARANR